MENQNHQIDEVEELINAACNLYCTDRFDDAQKLAKDAEDKSAELLVIRNGEFTNALDDEKYFIIRRLRPSEDIADEEIHSLVLKALETYPKEQAKETIRRAVLNFLRLENRYPDSEAYNKIFSITPTSLGYRHY
jgi:hypothetical protein